MYRRKNKSAYIYVWCILTIIVLAVLAMLDTKGDSIDIKSAIDFAPEKLSVGSKQSFKLLETYEQLDDWSEQLIEFDMQDASWLLRWEMSLTDNQLKELAQFLYVDQNNNLLNKVISQHGNHITGTLPYINGELTMQRVIDEAANVKTIAILILKHDSNLSGSVKRYIAHVDDTVSRYSDKSNASLKITGRMKDDALARIEAVTSSTMVEEYKDNSMNVITAHSTDIKKSYWLTNKKMVNLQYATYVDKNTEDSILTLAIPLISGEFGEVASN